MLFSWLRLRMVCRCDVDEASRITWSWISCTRSQFCHKIIMIIVYKQCINVFSLWRLIDTWKIHIHTQADTDIHLICIGKYRFLISHDATSLYLLSLQGLCIQQVFQHESFLQSWRQLSLFLLCLKAVLTEYILMSKLSQNMKKGV